MYQKTNLEDKLCAIRVSLINKNVNLLSNILTVLHYGFTSFIIKKKSLLISLDSIIFDSKLHTQL